MAKFKLKAGAHVAKDLTRPILDDKGEETGRYESRAYRAGDVIESDEDLVARWGPDRVEYVGGDRAAQRRIAELEAELAREKAKVSAARGEGVSPDMPPAVFPGGQVSTGYQDGLDAASDESLRRIAQDEEIDLEGVTGRDETVRAIRRGRSSAAAGPKEEKGPPARQQPQPPPRPPAPAAHQPKEQARK